jgi:hypothetical protein
MMYMKTLLPVVAVVAFIAMIAIGERQVRSSPKWPPPARHELGGWVIEDPPILSWAAGLNLPASVPIFWMWAHNDAFAYALDDHRLIVYLPWILFVFGLWFFVGYRIDAFTGRHRSKSSMQRYLVLSAQAFITVELFYVVSGMIFSPGTTKGTAERVFILVWVLLVIVGWIEFVLNRAGMDAEKNELVSH